MEFISRTDVNRLARDKTIIGFGAGVIGKKSLKFLDGNIDFFIDNNSHKVGQKLDGSVSIRSVDYLSSEDLDNSVIILCSEKYEEMREQLQEKFEFHEQTFLSPLLKDYEVFQKLQNNASKSLLVSAYGTNGGLYLVNCVKEQYDCLWNDSLRGMEFVDNELLVASEYGEIFRINSLKPLKKEKIITPDDDYQIHGLRYWENQDILVLVSAQHDGFFFYDLSSGTIEEKWNLSDFTNLTDRHHINDLTIVENRVIFSLLSRSGWWKNEIYDGGIYQMNLKSPDEPVPLITDLVFPHSITFSDGNFYFLESMTGKLKRGSHQTIAKLPGFIRGLTKSDNMLYIGQSRNRRITTANQFLDAISMESGVFILDEQTSVFRFIKLPEMSDVYSIYNLEDTDFIST